MIGAGVHRRQAGFTLVEILVALLIFAIVVALAGSGIVQSMRMQRINEANTGMQGKLRRITEVISQDLRSTVLGGLAIHPYTPSSIAVSFSLADGGQSFQVDESVYTSGSKRIYANAGSAEAVGTNGRRVLVVNAEGEATVQTVGASGTGSLGNSLWSVSHSACTPVPYEYPVRLFVVDSVGYRFDPGPGAGAGTLFRRSMGDAAGEEPVAFGLSEFRIQYAYRGDNGTLRLENQPFTSGNAVLRVTSIGGVAYTLESLQVTVAAEEQIAGGRVVERSYVSQITMPSTGSITFRSVVSCV